MDFRRKVRARCQIKSEVESLEERYPHNVMLYRYPPTDDVKINEFEELALERLRVLRILEQATSKNLRFLSDEWKECVNGELTREGLRGYLRLCTTNSSNTHATGAKREADLQARHRDYLSHFILRLAYCRSEELKRWFVSREMELFRYKFAALSGPEIKHFLELNKLNYQPLNEEQKDEVKEGLYESTLGQSVSKIELLDFYKVPFTQVLDLVRSRRCYLKDGFAYVNTHDFVSVVGAMQQMEIDHGLQAVQCQLRSLESDERVLRLLKSLHTSYTGKDYTVNKDASVPIESLDQLSKKSMPLCMRACHEHIRTNHHIKHGGRMQYGLFLKGIGVTLEDSIRFWRDEFTKKIDAEKFAKSYEYNIHHNYGKKGSMVNYTPYSCLKIIQQNAVAGDCHGCPYKQTDPPTLKLKLAANGLAPAHVQEVMAYVSRGHYQLACGKYFQITHETATEMALTHPNQYFTESQILMGNRVDKKNERPGSVQRRILKRNTASDSTSQTGMAADDDDELWQVAETQETIYTSEKAVESAFDDDLDITEINY